MAMEDFRVDVVVGKGPGRHRDPAGDQPVHPGRRDHPGRPAHRAAARPVRLRRADGVLRAGRAAAGAAPQRRPAGGRAHRRRVGGDRRPVAGHPAHRQPAAAPGARLRRGRGRRPGHPRGRPGRAARSTTSTTSAWTGSTAPCSRRWSSASAAGRSASPRWPSPWGRSRNTVEEVCEPFLVRAGLLARTPRGRVATEAAWRHLGHPLPAPVARCWAGPVGRSAARPAHRRPRVRRQSPCSAPRLRLAGAQLVRPRPCASRPVARAPCTSAEATDVPERSRTGPAPTAEQHAR